MYATLKQTIQKNIVLQYYRLQNVKELKSFMLVHNEILMDGPGILCSLMVFSFFCKKLNEVIKRINLLK